MHYVIHFLYIECVRFEHINSFSSNFLLWWEAKNALFFPSIDFRFPKKYFIWDEKSGQKSLL